jgi:ribonucleoside-diphosphate reductase alpha chain
VQDRSSGALYETPQFMYLLIAATIFSKYPKETRLDYVKRYYDAISKHKINIPTPIMAGVRTPLRQYASCVLIDADDTLDSIFTSDMAIGRYVAQRAGIGINAGRIRGINAKIRGGEVQHTGVVPFLKKFEATVRCCTQNGIRGGSATVHFPIWHQEIEDIIVLKNNKGTEDNRVRKLDYSIQISKLFYERFIKTKTSHSSVRTTFLVCMMLLALMDLMSYTMFMNEMSLFQERLSELKNSFWIF